MPVAELGGIEIAYELVGAGQPWVITPGGRFTKDVGGLPEMARALADRGKQVLTWDRPNCGASSVVFRGASESEVQAEVLGALLRHLDLGPTSLRPYNTEFLDRLTQLDVRGSKSFLVTRYRIEAQIELFNLLNSDAADTVRGVNFGTAAYQQAASAVQGRIIRLGAQVKW